MTQPSPRFPPPWTPAPERLFPGPDELVVIVANLQVGSDRLQALRSAFSAREEERFQSFATDALRSIWGAARGTLREVLGRALGCAPAEVQFRYAPHGKPYLPDSALRFNISHSGALGLIALSRAEVGADVELPRARRSDAIARRFFAPGESDRLFAERDAEKRADLFFRLWTCKEAFLKVTGEGFSRSTRSFEIALSPPRILWATGIPDAARRYSVHPLEVGDPYRAAVVADARAPALRTYRWS